MKYLLILLFSVGLLGCDPYGYAILTKNGILYSHLKSIEDCERIITKLKIDGICIKGRS